MRNELENGNGTDEVRYLDVCKMIFSPRLREDNDEKSNEFQFHRPGY